jgi:hypothetical protein
LDNNLSVLEEIDEYKLEQLTPDSYELHLASRTPDKQTLSESAALVLKGLYGKEAKIAVIHEAMVAPEASGKYRLSKTLFPLKIEDYLEKI